jgi:hypothetical protein
MYKKTVTVLRFELRLPEPQSGVLTTRRYRRYLQTPNYLKLKNCTSVTLLIIEKMKQYSYLKLPEKSADLEAEDINFRLKSASVSTRNTTTRLH